ncbi:MAG: hypothetical protein OK438_04500 [Thaumarchaeota archaeon]|nr:hypothetical protein [Nitrososphaerota archaeon]
MDISRQVFWRSARMGLGYVILGLIMGIFLTVAFNIGARVGNVIGSNGNAVDLSSVLSQLAVPTGALVGLVITTPVYLLFVNDKNAGVLEYLLAVGMDQRDIFMGYLRAAVMLSLVAMVPVVVINIAFMNGGLQLVILGAFLALATGISDVALVTILMTGFSSMQRRPTGMNSPLGISIGVVLLIPEFFLISVLQAAIVWVEGALAVGLLVAALLLLFFLERFVKREKFLP